LAAEVEEVAEALVRGEVLALPVQEVEALAGLLRTHQNQCQIFRQLA